MTPAVRRTALRSAAVRSGAARGVGRTTGSTARRHDGCEALSKACSLRRRTDSAILLPRVSDVEGVPDERRDRGEPRRLPVGHDESAAAKGIEPTEAQREVDGRALGAVGKEHNSVETPD